MQDTNYYSSIRQEIYPYIPQNIRKTLDVGCGSGEFSKFLKTERDVETWGIEMVESVAEKAKNNIDNVLIGTYESVFNTLPENYFDCVFFNDVLEHMPNPEDCLMKLRDKLQENATIIASIPNVRHLSILKEFLIKKDWRYRDFGILDRTHLRFFTRKSIGRMFSECGYNYKLTGLNKGKDSWKCDLLNISTLGLLFNDIKYIQYIVVAHAKQHSKIL